MSDANARAVMDLVEAQADVVRLRERVDVLIAERDKAREECGYQRRMKDFIAGERDGFIKYYRQLNAVRDLIAHARLISPSDRAVIYVADLERALGIAAPVPHKLGGNDA